VEAIERTFDAFLEEWIAGEALAAKD